MPIERPCEGLSPPSSPPPTTVSSAENVVSNAPVDSAEALKKFDLRSNSSTNVNDPAKEESTSQSEGSSSITSDGLPTGHSHDNTAESKGKEKAEPQQYTTSKDSSPAPPVTTGPDIGDSALVESTSPESTPIQREAGDPPSLRRSDTEAGRSWLFQEKVVMESAAKLPITKERLYKTSAQIAEGCGLSPEEPFQSLIAPTQRGILGNGRYGVVEEVAMPSKDLQEMDTIVRKRFDIRGERRRISQVKKEISVLKKLFHPHIVRHVMDYEEDAGRYAHKVFILMSPVGDNDLRAFLHNAIPYISKGIDPEYSKFTLYLRTWIQCLASALKYIHNQRIQHEDIKPSNIIYRDGDVLFTDFGSSRELMLDDATSTESPALATRLFAAPEALVDEDGNLSRHGYGTDVFSLGLVFVEMLWILNGAELPLRQHLEEQSVAGTIIYQYYDVMEDINVALMNSDCARMYSVCVKPMLNIERYRRPDASAVLSAIVYAQAGSHWRTLVCPCQYPLE
jgi:hypothetical protein